MTKAFLPNFYLILSVILAIYIALFLPSAIAYSQVEIGLHKIFNFRISTSIFNFAVLILPAILTFITMVILVRYFGLSLSAFKKRKGLFFSLTTGHLGFVALYFDIKYAGQLIGWLAIPIYLWFSLFYGIGLAMLFAQLERDKKIKRKVVKG